MNNNQQNKLAIGLMSGTSKDGIDVALIKTDGQQALQILASHYLPYDDDFRQTLHIAELATTVSYGNRQKAEAYLQSYSAQSATSESSLADIERSSTKKHIAAVKRLIANADYSLNDIDVIGYHGQTLYHNPSERITIQLGDGPLMARELSVEVVNDFRSNDVAQGGQGAPLAPIYHHLLVQRCIHENPEALTFPIVFVNCGGIANVTIIHEHATENDLLAFDTGPGNTLINQFVQLRTGEAMDTHGHYGKTGQVDKDMFAKLYEASCCKAGVNYYHAPLPKSLDISDFHLPDMQGLSLPDACRTLEAFTAYTIVDGVKAAGITQVGTWLLAGGGWRNPVILDEFKALAQGEIQQAEAIGYDSDMLEAQLFAYLAVRSQRGLALSFPGTTGVSQPMTGGVLHRP